MEDLISAVKQALRNNDTATAVEQIQEYLEKERNIPLNIAVTGECGSGKSTFVNAFRGIKNKDEGAAPTGAVETTTEVTPYTHPNYPNVTLWDCPGIGTTRFPAKKYLELVEFEKFDFFIIISADRFRENDVKLAQEIERVGKKFYFVRSKIDHNLRDEEESQKEFDAQKTLASIKKNCTDGLRELGIESPVFLVSSRDLRCYDFPLLHQTLETDLPVHKRDALLLAMPNINEEIIIKKKEAFQAKIKYYAIVSGAVAGVPLPGLSFCVDLALLVSVVTSYVLGFGLDIPSLKRLSATTGVPYKELLDVIISPQAVVKVDKELIMKLVAQFAVVGAMMASEEVCKWIPLFGIPAAAALSFTATYSILKRFLNMLANDAQLVFKRALGLNTSVFKP
ncbi:hypothetical protein ACER0C_003518 [Sarotherodon galilaeus]